MGSVLCKEDAIRNEFSKSQCSSSSAFESCDVDIDWNGCRKFPRLPSVGEHPRLLFTKAELSQILRRFSHNPISPQLNKIIADSLRDCLSRYDKIIATITSEEFDNPLRKETIQQFLTVDEFKCTTFLAAYVSGKLNNDNSIVEKVKQLTIFHAKLILRSLHLATVEKYSEKPFDIWHHKSWDLKAAWLFGGTGYALLYDLSYDELNEVERTIVRKSITEAVKGRRSWGMGWASRRIQSNWAPYHGDLLSLCAVTEGEDGFDSEVYEMFSDLMIHFMDYAVYDSGHPVEDAYALNLALREGSLSFLVLARRGLNLFNHPHYKPIWTKWIPYALEPQNNGRIYGGSSGSIWEYPTSAIIAKYMFPKDKTIDYVFRIYMSAGKSSLARITKIQSRLAVIAFAIPPLFSPESFAKLNLPLTYSCKARGKVIMRSAWSRDAVWFTLDARPDGFLIGHDTCSRGSFVMNAIGRNWGYCPEWKWYTESSDYSLPHIDGIGQRHKAPFVKILSINDENELFTFTSADLTYAYNWKWTTWAKFDEEYSNHGYELEPNDPRDFGFNAWWSPNKLYEETTVGFAGLQQWRKRFATVEKVIRNVMLVRAQIPFVIVCDQVRKDEQCRQYSWAMTTPNDVNLISFDGTDAMLGEDNTSGRRLLVRCLTKGNQIDCSLRKIVKDNLRTDRDEKPNQLMFTCDATDVTFYFLMFPLATRDSDAPETVWKDYGKFLQLQTSSHDTSYEIRFSKGEFGEIDMSAIKTE